MENSKKDIIFCTKEDLKNIYAEDKVIKKDNLKNKKAAAQHKKYEEGEN